MSELLVDEIEDDVLEKLQKRARRHGRSTEEEVREILRNAVMSESDAPVRAWELGSPKSFAASASKRRSPNCAAIRPSQRSSIRDSARYERHFGVHEAGAGCSSRCPGSTRTAASRCGPRRSRYTRSVSVLKSSRLAGADSRWRKRFARALEEAFRRTRRSVRRTSRAGGRPNRRLHDVRIGRPVEIRDLQIAGIAIARKAAIATRNIRHFEGLGVDLIDPWAA